jgi:hypothetical protein
MHRNFSLSFNRAFSLGFNPIFHRVTFSVWQAENREMGNGVVVLSEDRHI